MGQSRSSLLRDWFPCAGAVLSLAQTHRGHSPVTLPKKIQTHLQQRRESKLVVAEDQKLSKGRAFLFPYFLPFTQHCSSTQV